MNVQLYRFSFSILLAAWGGLLWGLGPVPTLAVSVAPNRVTQSLAVGEVFEKKIHLENDSETEHIYQFTLVPFELDELGKIILDQGSTSALSWFTLDQPQVTLAPQAETEVTVMLIVPAETTPGGYAAALKVFPVDTPEDISSTRFFINVKGAIPSGEFPLFITKQAVYEPEQQVPFHIEFKNTGATHIIPLGKIDLYRGADWVGDIELNPTKEIVMPGTIRQFDLVWDSTLGFGKYTAVVTVNANNDVSIKSSPVSFWILSWERIVPVAVLLITFLIAASVLLRHPAKESS